MHSAIFFCKKNPNQESGFSRKTNSLRSEHFNAELIIIVHYISVFKFFIDDVFDLQIVSGAETIDIRQCLIGRRKLFFSDISRINFSVYNVLFHNAQSSLYA